MTKTAHSVSPQRSGVGTPPPAVVACPLWEDYTLVVAEETRRLAEPTATIVGEPSRVDAFVATYMRMIDSMPGAARRTVSLDEQLDLLKLEEDGVVPRKDLTASEMLEVFQREERARSIAYPTRGESRGAAPTDRHALKAPRGVISSLLSVVPGGELSPQNNRRAGKEDQRARDAKNSPTPSGALSPGVHDRTLAPSSAPQGGATKPTRRATKPLPDDKDTEKDIGMAREQATLSALSRPLSAASSRPRTPGRASRRSASQRSEASETDPYVGSASQNPKRAAELSALADVRATQRRSWRPSDDAAPTAVAYLSKAELDGDAQRLSCEDEVDKRTALMRYLDAQAGCIPKDVIDRNMARLAEEQRRELSFRREPLAAGHTYPYRYVLPQHAGGGEVAAAKPKAKKPITPRGSPDSPRRDETKVRKSPRR